MEAVGQLTGGLAHDFNNPLTGVMGNLELLQMRVARGRLDDLDRFIGAAQGAGRRAAALTQRLLAFSRRQTLDPKPTDVNQLIAGLEEMLHRTVGSMARSKSSVPSGYGRSVSTQASLRTPSSICALTVATQCRMAAS
jgi:signal transduction histidine kinase